MINFSNLLKISWHILRSRLSTVSAITLFLIFPLSLVISFLSVETFIGEISGHWLARLLAFPFGLATGILTLVPFMALVSITERAFHDEEIPAWQAVREQFAKWPQAIVAHLLAVFIIFGAGLFLFFPGILFLIYYLFWMKALVLRGRRGMNALNYSKSLVSGRWWEVFIVFFPLVLLLFVSHICLYLLVSKMAVAVGLESRFPGRIIIYGFAAFIHAFLTIVTTILFLHLELLQKAFPSAERLKESIEGYVSVAAFALSAILLCGSAIISNLYPDRSVFAPVAFGLILPFFGFFVGIAGLYQRNTNKKLSKLGIVFNGIFVFPCILAIVVGAVMSFF